MKRLMIAAMALTLLGTTGCMTGQMNKVVTALGKDPATVSIRVTSIYGTITFVRTNPQTNSLPHNVSPDGAVTVSVPAKP